MREKVPALLLAILLLIGCGSGERNAEPTPLPLSTPTAEPAPTPMPEPSAEPVLVSAAEAEAALQSAWRSGETDRESFDARGSGDTMTLHNNTLYVIRKKRVCVYHLENGGFYSLSPIAIGFDWLESRDENGWVGCEKTPLELFVSGERLAVLSAWAEYSETNTETGLSFADHSRTVLDIFDVSDPADPVLVASYGQDGGQCAGYADDEGHLWLLSRRSVYEADHAVPAVHNSEHRIELSAEQTDVQRHGGRAQTIVLGLYDLTDGLRTDARCLIGGGAVALLGAEGAYILGGGEKTAVIHYPVDSESIAEPVAVLMQGTLLDALLSDTLYLATEGTARVCFSALSPSLEPLWDRELGGSAQSWSFGKDCFRLMSEESLQLINLSDRSLREGKLSARRAERLDEKHWIALDYQSEGHAIDLVLLRAGAKGALKEAGGLLLSYNYRPALEEETGVWLHEGLLALGSEYGCSLYRYSSDGFVHCQDVSTSDNSAHMRFYILGDYLYIADTREVHALRISDLVFVGEWFL